MSSRTILAKSGYNEDKYSYLVGKEIDKLKERKFQAFDDIKNKFFRCRGDNT